jgi:hypothetical protein
MISNVLHFYNEGRLFVCLEEDTLNQQVEPSET